MESGRYVQPGWFTRNVFNRLVAALTRAGVSVIGSRVLRVPGRKTGEPRETPVNVLTLDDVRYLVSPRGTTQWVRNVRAAGGGELVLGRSAESFRAVEVDNADKTDILRSYLRRWAFEVGAFFDGVNASSTDEELRRIAPGHPVFRIEAPRPGPER